MKESEVAKKEQLVRAEHATYLNQHIYGIANSLVARLQESGALDVPGYWSYPDEEEDDYGREIFSWWIVSDNMAHRLRKAGYCVLDFEEEIYLWGRTSHGIAMYLEEGFMEDLGI
ncbi:hypothetical protein [Burkholderia multivorans]|uniref:hypothetical protein n=1 Tax=Burkholderia multivorans TaxID=87883 RepID=UPI0021BE4BB9|nr:hypothetical protein [Burkholderia multivorans]